MILKKSLISAAVLFSTMLSTVAPIAVNAATTTGSGTAQVQVNGSDGVELLNAPSFTYNNVDLASAGTSVSSTQKDNTNQTTTKAASTLVVKNAHDASDTWQVTTQLSNMTGKTNVSNTLPGAQIEMFAPSTSAQNVNSASNTSKVVSSTPTVVAGGAAQKVADNVGSGTTALTGLGTFTSDYSATGSTKLDVPSVSRADTYTGTLTYTLAAVPQK
jgi:hypothetical protein